MGDIFSQGSGWEQWGTEHPLGSKLAFPSHLGTPQTLATGPSPWGVQVPRAPRPRASAPQVSTHLHTPIPLAPTHPWLEPRTTRSPDPTAFRGARCKWPAANPRAGVSSEGGANSCLHTKLTHIHLWDEDADSPPTQRPLRPGRRRARPEPAGLGAGGGVGREEQGRHPSDHPRH